MNKQQKNAPMLLPLVEKTLLLDCQVPRQSRILVAVSGGSDSLALLSLLHECSLFLDLSVVYIDHGLRPLEIPREKECIRSLCQAFALPFSVRSVAAREYQQKHRISLEESCRILRYRELEAERELSNCTYIAVAHTADDQAEEVLLRLLRGTGSAGLSGMRKRRGSLIRPLLDILKQDLIAYLQQKKIVYCHDSSNDDLRFLRNRIRHQLLPLLQEQYNPAMGATLRQTADILLHEDMLLEDLAQQAFDKITVLPTVQETRQRRPNVPITFPDPLTPLATLLLASFLPYPVALRRRILEKLCIQTGFRPSYQQIVHLDAFCNTGRTGAELQLSKGIRAIKSNTLLYFFRTAVRQSARTAANTEERGNISLTEPCPARLLTMYGRILTMTPIVAAPENLPAHTLLMDAEKICYPLTIRSHLEGERFLPDGANGHKKIARFLADLKIPAHERRNYPLLLQDNDPIAILGLRIAERVKPTPATTHFLLIGWLSSCRLPSREENTKTAT